MKRFESKSCVFLFLIVLFASSSASATQVAYRSVETMGEQAPLVIRGEVSAVRSFWNEERTRILTEVSVQVSQRFKGSGPSEIRVVQMGGVVDGVRMTVAGSLEWAPGEDVVLFLEDSMPGRYRVSGFSQGKFFIERDPRSGEEIVVQASLGDALLVGGQDSNRATKTSLQRLLTRALPQIREER